MKLKLKEREQFLVNRYMRRQLAWNAQTKSIEQHIGEQYLELPCSICTPNGAPHKGKKICYYNMLLSFWKHNKILLVWFLKAGLLTVLLWKAGFY